MKTKVNLRVEIIEGEDAGYVLEETNRTIDLQRTFSDFPEGIIPYRLVVEFVTPNLFRGHLRGEEE